MSEGPEDGAVGWESDPVPVLERWEHAGALWRVLLERRAETVVGLFTCDGGEEIARFRCPTDALAPLVHRGHGSDDRPAQR